MIPPATTAHPLAGAWRALRERFQALLQEIGKFGVVGAVCYGIDVAVFNVVLHDTREPILALVVSTVVATTAAFVGNRFWTWRDRDRSGLTREYLLYFGVNLVGLGIGAACLGVSHYWLGGIWPQIFATGLADNVSGKIIGVFLASLFRFWAYRRFVFRPVLVPSESD